MRSANRRLKRTSFRSTRRWTRSTRISQTTQFQGQALLDGSLDFQTQGISSSQITKAEIHQCAFGTASQIDIAVDIQAQATKAELTYDNATVTEDTMLSITGSGGNQSIQFGAGSSINDMAAAINRVSDATGVTATAEGVQEWDAAAGTGDRPELGR